MEKSPRVADGGRWCGVKDSGRVGGREWGGLKERRLSIALDGWSGVNERWLSVALNGWSGVNERRLSIALDGWSGVNERWLSVALNGWSGVNDGGCGVGSDSKCRRRDDVGGVWMSRCVEESAGWGAGLSSGFVRVHGRMEAPFVGVIVHSSLAAIGGVEGVRASSVAQTIAGFVVAASTISGLNVVAGGKVTPGILASGDLAVPGAHECGTVQVTSVGQGEE
jgi:hypothetical protein